MDRPEEIRCYSCSGNLGYIGGVQVAVRCGTCNAYSTLNADSVSVRASDALLELQAKVEELDRAYAETKKNYQYSVYGGASIGYRHFDPVGPGLVLSNVYVLLVGVAVSILFLYCAQWILAIVIFGAVAWYFKKAKAICAARWEVFQRLSSEHEQNRKRLLNDLYSELGKL